MIKTTSHKVISEKGFTIEIYDVTNVPTLKGGDLGYILIKINGKAICGSQITRKGKKLLCKNLTKAAVRVRNMPKAKSAVGDADVTDVNESIINEVNTQYDEKKDHEVRPARMKKPSVSKYEGRGVKSVWPQIYIQDEAKNILQDKYGPKRGTENWDYFVNSNTNAMFTVCSNICKEKAVMLEDLGKKYDHNNYWEFGWYPLWKEWMKLQGVKK